MDFLKGPGKVVLYVLPLFSLLFMIFQPAALQLYFVSTGVFALAQSSVIHKPWFRESLRMTVPIVSNSAPTVDRSQSVGVARLQQRIEEERQRMAELNKPAQEETATTPESYTKVSAIDKLIDKGTKGLSEWSQSANEAAGKSWDSMRGKPSTNADGSPIAGPRLSDAERKKAEEYEKERKSAEAFAREERNYARRQAHMRALAAEREKAKASWQKQQEAAVNNQTRRRK